MLETEIVKVIESFNVITINSLPYNNKNTVINYNNDISLGLLIPPSDPDFPFDVPLLHLLLLVPKEYPTSKPQVMVLNDDIPRGFSYNIELGFKNLTGELKDDDLNDLECEKSLFGYINGLDKYLERFLRMEKKEAKIKIVKAKPNKQKNKKTNKDKSKLTKPTTTTPIETNNEFKDSQIKILKSRFNVKTVKDGSTYKLSLKLYEAFQFQFDSQTESITFSIIHIKLIIPNDYGKEKGRNKVKLEIDFSHPEVMKLINGIKNNEIKLVLKNLLMNISKNFDQFSSKFRYYKLTEYLNFTVSNLSKLMGDQNDFSKFLDTL